MLSWGMLCIGVIFNVIGVFVIKMKLNELGPMKVDSFKAILSYLVVMCKSPVVIVGVTLFFLAPFVLAVALSRMEISIAYPAQVGLNFLILFILAVLFLGETLTIHKIIGALLVLASIYFFQK